MFVERNEWDGTRGSAKTHKLRRITKSSSKSDTFGITLPRDKVEEYVGVWFSTTVIKSSSGTMLVLTSGAKI